MELLVKGNAMKNMYTNMALLIIEVVGCFIILMLLCSLPSPVVNMSMSLRELISVFRFSTHSVFIIGNLIIILVVKLSGDTTSSPTHKLEIVRDQYVTESRRRVIQLKKVSVSDEEPRETRTDQLCPAPVPAPIENVVPAAAAAEEVVVVTAVVPEINSQVYRRTLSASYERGGVVRAKRPELRRSKTVKRDGDVTTTTFDELNHDEFRRKIETFIAKQRRMIREEM